MQIPLKRNQLLAIKYLKQYRYDTILMVSDEENEQRMQLMVKGSTQKSKMSVQEKNDLEYHYQMVRVMATCCIGENQLVKSFCQNIFDTNEVGFESFFLERPPFHLAHKVTTSPRSSRFCCTTTLRSRSSSVTACFWCGPISTTPQFRPAEISSWRKICGITSKLP